jgi:hypothetical protein
MVKDDLSVTIEAVSSNEKSVTTGYVILDGTSGSYTVKWLQLEEAIFIPNL